MTPRLAYLLSQYPTIGHTFLLREMQALRAHGIHPLVISVRPADRPPDRLTPEEREEWSRTRVIFSLGWLAAAAVQLRVFAARPGGYLRGLRCALRMAGWNLERLAAYLTYFAEAVIAGHWVWSQGFTHLHSHFTSTVALLAARVFPLRVSLTLHGPDEFIDPLGFHLEQKVAGSELVCAISQYARSQIMRYSRPADWGKIVVLPLGVDTSVYAPRPFRAAPEVFEIVYVGRLAPVKGLPVLLSALQILLQQGRSVRLRLAGGGPSRIDLEREIAARGLSAQVLLEGNLTAPAVRELYRTADIFALASFAEGIPVVLMEAMAMEIPCVATRITGIPELIRDGVDGLLATPSNAGELAQAIARLMDDPLLRKSIGEAGRRRVEEHFNLAGNTAALARTFAQYLARSPG